MPNGYKRIYNGILNIKPAMDDYTKIIASDSTMYLSGCLVGEQSNSKKCIITNKGSDDVTIERMTVSGNFLISLTGGDFSQSLGPFNLAPEEELAFYASCLPDRFRRFEGRVEIIASNNNQNRYLAIDLIGYGLHDIRTVVYEGPVSGLWDSNHSPYYICGDIFIESDNSLFIGPGVKVLFQDAYKFSINSNAQLRASGNEKDSVLFRAENPFNGWNGLNFLNSGNDDTLAFCSIKNSKSSGKTGGAISCLSSSPSILNCLIAENEGINGGGLYCGESSPVFTLSRFNNNLAEYGGALYLENSTVQLYQTLFSNNISTKNGGAIYSDKSNVQINNVTFARNVADRYGGAIYLEDDSYLNIKNSVYSANKANRGGHILSLRSPNDENIIDFSYSCLDTSGVEWLDVVFNGSLGDNRINMVTGNIFQNPLFVDYENNDFHLALDSPCIDNGDPSDGWNDEPFPHGFRRNMGAFGGTVFAAPTTAGRLTVTPDPINFGYLGKNDWKELPIVLKNGSLQRLDITDILLSNGPHFYVTSKFGSTELSMHLESGQIDTILLAFDPAGGEQLLYSDSLRIKFANAPEKIIYVFAQNILGTPVDSGEVAGTWTKENSPYNIFGNIFIAENNALVLLPGVDVVFMGNYTFTIGENAQLLAIGTKTDSISLTAADPEVGWNGLHFMLSGEDDSLLFCEISNIKSFGDMNRFGTFQKDGAIDIESSSPIFSNCLFQNNIVFDDALIFFYFARNAQIKFSKFINNSIYTGTFIKTQSSLLKIDNSLFYKNEFDYFVVPETSDILLSNLVVTKNTRVEQTAHFISRWNGNSELYVKNSILWGNQNISIFNLYENDKATFLYCNIDTSYFKWVDRGNSQSGSRGKVFWGEGNLNANPLFMNPGNYDFRLLADSPCVDSGDPNDNVAHEPFPHGYRINMGSYGGTAVATKTQNKCLATVPKPLDFGVVSPGSSVLGPLYLKNGTLADIVVNSLTLSDTTNFSFFADGDKVFGAGLTIKSGDIDSILVKLETEDLTDSSYTAEIIATTQDCLPDTIPVIAFVQSGTAIIEENVSGTWTKTNSPYNIYCDIHIEKGNRLIIGPGVKVRFMGSYRLGVLAEGTISAVGTESDSIYFCASDTSQGWLGLNVFRGANSVFSYCEFKNAKSTSSYHYRNFLIQSKSVTFSHCTFEKNVSTNNSTNFECSGSEITFMDCRFINNTSYRGGAIYSYKSDLHLIRCLFYQNSARNGGAIYCHESQLELRNCVISQNRSQSLGNAIFLSGANTVNVNNSILWNNPGSPPLTIFSSENSVLNFSYSCMDTRGSTWLAGYGGAKGQLNWGYGNIETDPLFTDAANGDFSLLAESPCIDGGDPNEDILKEPFPHGYRINMGLYGGTENAAKTTRATCTVSPNPINFGPISPGEEKVIKVFLKNGSPSSVSIGDIQLSNPDHFELFGPLAENPKKTLSSGQIDSLQLRILPDFITNESWADSLIITGPEIGDVKIDVLADIKMGTIIPAGNVFGRWTEANSPYRIYGHVLVPEDEKLQIGPGVDVRFYNYSGLTVGTNAQILAIGDVADSIKFQPGDIENGWPGISFNNSSNDDTLKFCSVSGGKPFGSGENSNGGAIHISRSSPTILHSAITNNTAINGGAIYFNESNSLLSHCTIFRNRASQNGGAFYVNNSAPVIKNSMLFSNNANSSGGCAIFYGTGTTTFENTVVTLNEANNGGLFYLMNSDTLYLKNSIFWENTTKHSLLGDIGSNYPPETLRIIMNYCCIDTSKDLWLSKETLADKFEWGVGNIVDNPMFNNLEEFDFTLRMNSPCVDAGNPGPGYNDIHEPENPDYALWPARGTVRNDMGAFGGDFVNYRVTAVEHHNPQIPSQFNLDQNYPNPFNSGTSINFALPEQRFVTITIYNILGQNVKTIANQNFVAGVFQLNWDGTNDNNELAGTGIYFYQMIAGDFQATKKTLLMR
jgi:predicted outer membrane repeat protein